MTIATARRLAVYPTYQPRQHRRYWPGRWTPRPEDRLTLHSPYSALIRTAEAAYLADERAWTRFQHGPRRHDPATCLLRAARLLWYVQRVHLARYHNAQWRMIEHAPDRSAALGRVVAGHNACPECRAIPAAAAQLHELSEQICKGDSTP